MTEEEIQALKEELESTKTELEPTKAELETVRAELQSIQSALEAAQIERTSATDSVTDLSLKLETSLNENQALEEKLSVSEGLLSQANTSITDLVSAYKESLALSNPSIPVALITGDTIQAVNQSLENARVMVDKVKANLETEIASGKVPAGAPPRTEPDLSALSPREKIQYAITKEGGNK